MRSAHLYRATVILHPGVDERELGAAVTVELCGSWDHEGSCRWPHHNRIHAEGTTTSFNTIFVCEPEERDEIGDRIDRSLRSCGLGDVCGGGITDVSSADADLAARLTRS
jgi:hypothetical protein